MDEGADLGEALTTSVSSDLPLNGRCIGAVVVVVVVVVVVAVVVGREKKDLEDFGDRDVHHLLVRRGHPLLAGLSPSRAFENCHRLSLRWRIGTPSAASSTTSATTSSTTSTLSREATSATPSLQTTTASTPTSTTTTTATTASTSTTTTTA